MKHPYITSHCFSLLFSLLASLSIVLQLKLLLSVTMTQDIPFKVFGKEAGRLLYIDAEIDWNGLANKIVQLFPDAGDAEDIQLLYKDNDGKPMVFDTTAELSKIIQRICNGEQLQFKVWNKQHAHHHHHHHHHPGNRMHCHKAWTMMGVNINGGSKHTKDKSTDGNHDHHHHHLDLLDDVEHDDKQCDNEHHHHGHHHHGHHARPFMHCEGRGGFGHRMPSCHHRGRGGHFAGRGRFGMGGRRGHCMAVHGGH
ncbi:hypothetical protein SYNPS1DRAFT_27124 [Syncephalis pseudoplumigaleata]|uniref:PB1 domain-containing protein n=1 Tax=Syncephalis pseudoplumigaleata TaxID=1712513 RepID=A0A4P9Z5X2_9FUNG|nr:hypothetical protein SYNPS1DRAFT_27124 [Syncephalis pseudoplumigaleata]|eukprot:RKP27211.1 hypothetical protein SYNPS1DRAFT_27124 [Syncephalis pseudoplumigaleata]